MKDTNEKTTLTQKLSGFFSRHRNLLVIFAAIMVVAIVGAFVWDRVSAAKAKEATLMSEQVMEAYSDWVIEMDDSDKEAELSTLMETALSDFKGSFAEQRALFTRGQYYIKKEMWAEASADFARLAEEFPESYLAPVALYNAASTIEQAGSNDKALGYYQQLVDNYKDDSAEIPEAIFQLGRISETMGDTEKAVAYYEQLILDFSDTDWTNLAKSRIIALNL